MRYSLSLLVCLYSCLASADISVRDVRGQVLVLSQPAQRVVALAPHFVENLYAIGAGAQLVAAGDFVDYPPEALQLPSIGGYNSLSLEAILQFQPDLILGWQSGNNAGLLDQLERLGLPLFLEEPQQLEDVALSLENLGRLTGHNKQARRVATDYREELQRLRQTYAQQNPVRVFYQIWHSPLQTLNGRHVVSDMIRLCGGRNVFAQAVPLAPRVSVEAVLAAAPELIVASGQNQESSAQLTMWRAWPDMPAVENRQLVVIRPDWMLRFTPRMLLGAARLCEILEQAR